MTINERLQVLELELHRSIARESRHACAAGSMDEMISDLIIELRDIAGLKMCNTVVRKNLMRIVLRCEKDIAAISSGVEYVRRRRSPED